jgi:hypothetical protein
LKKKAEDDCGVFSSAPVHIETRVALLEQSIRHINETMIRIEKGIGEIKKEAKYDFRFLIGAICGLAAVMAHGFHWF